MAKCNELTLLPFKGSKHIRSTDHAVLCGERNSLLSVAFKQRSTQSEACSTVVKDDRLQLAMVTNENHVTCT